MLFRGYSPQCELGPFGACQFLRLGDDVVDRSAVIDCQSLAAWDFKLPGIEAQLLEDCGVNVGDVVAIFHRVKSEFVCGAVHIATLDAAASHPHRKSKRMVVATIRALRTRRPAKLCCEDDDRLVQQAAAVEIFQERTDRLINREGEFCMVGLESRVGIPCAGPATAMLNLNKTHAPFHKSPRG